MAVHMSNRVSLAIALAYSGARWREENHNTGFLHRSGFCGARSLHKVLIQPPFRRSPLWPQTSQVWKYSCWAASRRRRTAAHPEVYTIEGAFL